MICLKNADEISLIRESAQLVSKTLGMLASEIRPGIDTLYLDLMAEAFIRDHGGIPGFLGLYNFPNTLCISPNEQVVHGIPNDKVLREGDIVSIDCGVLMNDYYGDHAYTFEVGEVKPEIKELLKATKDSLYIGINACRKGHRTGDIGYAIQNHVEQYGYGVVRELVGHGLGKQMHEDPQIPNYGSKGHGMKLAEGMVLAIEPMINQGTHRVRFHKDGWTVTTADKKPSAHFEHDVAIAEGKPILLSTFDYIYKALGISSKEEAPFLPQ
ncbi:type I methionyl aminopeptidase [Bacteroidetes bacterium endosymbiont of Geopemphigus sp.]|uniref:type I methionyl aminopeptidase n=1 Tax=Bacteroidetes bacterium endosymbiont of Geopemphigus sp. TaxID=2047937 RepID=UPI000CD1DFED|nr:type I methionyl aminopeptidase [Bacteroidetes bacterium endosymbiont of Geopemphigus sp.]